MRSFINIINEGLGLPQPIKWRAQSWRGWLATFSTDKHAYEVSFVFRNEEVPAWEVKFAQVTKKLFRRTTYNTSLTGTGAAVTVMSSVLECIRQFVTEVHPQVLYFTANTDSRKRLYGRLAQKAVAFGYTVREIEHNGVTLTLLVKGVQ